jgi:Ca2+-binding RTX toxin-like protein
MANFLGTAGNDMQDGTNSDDVFDYKQGGRDTLNGKGGNDSFDMGIELRANDRINGGGGTFDTVFLGGAVTPYSVVLADDTIKNCEFLQMNSGDYSVTTADGNVAAGANFSVLASAATSMFFDGSAETDGSFSMDTSAGDDTLIGGQQNDIISGGTPFFSPAGTDTIKGEGGNDTLQFFDDLTAADKAVGGDGYDFLRLEGDYSSGLTLAGSTLKEIEEIDLDLFGGTFTYDLTFADGNLATGQVLAVDANTASQATLDASAESNATYVLSGGSGDDSLLGGGGNDTLRGAGDADFLRGGNGADEYRYLAASDSTGPTHDTVDGFNANADTFRLTVAVGAIDARVNSGTLNAASFNADLAGRIGAGKLGAGNAVLYKPDAGDLAGITFLIVDHNGTAGYQAGADLVVRLDTATHLNNLDTADFTLLV